MDIGERGRGLLVRGVVAHLVADWLLQSEWMARHKQSFWHPAAYVHAGIHAACAARVFGWRVGLGLGAAHLVIDERSLLRWWRRVMRQTTDTSLPVYIPFSMMQDQSVHFLCIAFAAWLCARNERRAAWVARGR